MKILISNDDGYKAQGIKFLNDELKQYYSTTVVAPSKERSSCGHGITLGEPIRLEEVKPQIYSCSGLPADCVLVGVAHLFKEHRPDLVISGINHGANLGQDRFYSGTMAAAREGVFRGIPSIAVSLVTKNFKDMEHFEVAAKIVRIFIQNKLDKMIPELALVNINVPNIPWEKIAGVQLTRSGFQVYSEEIIERVDGRGKSYYWVGGTYQGHNSIEKSDCNAVADNFVSIDLQDISGRDLISKEQYKEFDKAIEKVKWENE